MDTNVTNDFALFLMHQGLDDIQFTVAVNQEDFKSVGHDVNFMMFQSSQALNKMCNKEPPDTMLEADEQMWFFA